MKNYFIDEVLVVIDGEKSENVTITGQGSYNPRMVTNKAIEMVKETYEDAKVVAEIQSHREVDLEEYERIIGSKPSWLGNIS